MLQDVSLACQIGGKSANNWHENYSREFKLHLDDADRRIQIGALLTAANVND
jgi:hypothetical protein